MGVKPPPQRLGRGNSWLLALQRSHAAAQRVGRRVAPRLLVPGPPLVPAGLTAGGGEHLKVTLLAAFQIADIASNAPAQGHHVDRELVQLSLWSHCEKGLLEQAEVDPEHDVESWL